MCFWRDDPAAYPKVRVLADSSGASTVYAILAAGGVFCFGVSLGFLLALGTPSFPLQGTAQD